jgi:PAS domain S-box-containing protein
VIGVGQDITERKKAEVESGRIAQELINLIDTANAPIFGIDKDGRVTEWNRTAVSITGYEKQETLGKKLVEEFITEEYKIAVKEVLDKALKGTETANFELPLYTKKRDRRDVLLNATTRRDVQGNIIGVIGVGQDITERKQLEKKLEEYAKGLETKVVELERFQRLTVGRELKMIELKKEIEELRRVPSLSELQSVS